MEDSYGHNQIPFDPQADPIVTNPDALVSSSAPQLLKAGHLSQSPRFLHVFNQRPDPTEQRLVLQCAPVYASMRRSPLDARTTLFRRFFWTEQGKQNDVANGARTGEEHSKSVDAYALSAGGWHAVAQGADIIFVGRVS